MPFLPQPSPFIRAWDRHQETQKCATDGWVPLWLTCWLAAMTNLLHENKKMTVFETLEVLEALESKYSFVAGESVSNANVIIFLLKNDGIDTEEDDRNDVNCIPYNLCERQLPSDTE